MNRFNIGFLFPLLALIFAVLILSIQIGDTPPLGKFINPFIGAIQNDNNDNLDVLQLSNTELQLLDSVKIFFDSRKVPHIYANNVTDLYFAQGYVVASMRLWQMDFLSYISAGRLSEIFNKEPFLIYDRMQRRLGILDGAMKSLKLIEQNPETNIILTSYTKGVNAYIKQLGYKNIPLEYKILDYEPEPWSNLKTVLILKYMGNILSGYDEDISMTNLILALGEEKFNKLFPVFGAHVSPVISTSKEKLNKQSDYLKKPEYLDYSFLVQKGVQSKSIYNPHLGSNNWVVSGKKTKSRFPILCNDPHLNLTLPSIWFEMQLSSPNMNVYGVSIPGTPAIIIGFNENIAWGVTNGATDVKDWYKLKITNDYKKYEFDKQWLNLSYTIEKIKRKGGADFNDTIYRTIQGPIVSNKSFPQLPDLIDYSLKWELDKASNEFLTFILLNKAKNYEDYKAALKSYACPIQNFIFACKDDNIAINHQGTIGVKWKGQGKFVLDGSRKSDLYTKYIPNDSLPHLVNPECNYLFSANQQPTSSTYPYYYNGYYDDVRSNRIKELLEKDDKFDLMKMESMQLDNQNSLAKEILPTIINYINTHKLDANKKEIVVALSKWNYAYNFDDEIAIFFDIWWANIQDNTWDELKNYDFNTKTPDDYVLLDLIQKEPNNKFFDVQGTSSIENAGDVIFSSFVSSADKYTQMKNRGSVKWSDLNKINIMHMANIPAFSAMNIPSDGHLKALNAKSFTVGPSWRMIVELGDMPKAYGIFPGGESGNSGSRYYDNFVEDWNNGKYYRLQFFTSLKDAKKHSTSTWTLK